MRMSSSFVGEREPVLSEREDYPSPCVTLSSVGFCCGVMSRSEGEGESCVSWGSAPQPGGRAERGNQPCRGITASQRFTSNSCRALCQSSALHMWGSVRYSDFSRSLACRGLQVGPQSSLMDNQIGLTWHRKSRSLSEHWKSHWLFYSTAKSNLGENCVFSSLLCAKINPVLASSCSLSICRETLFFWADLQK